MADPLSKVEAAPVVGATRGSSQSQNVNLYSETSTLHWNCKYRDVWGRRFHILEMFFGKARQQSPASLMLTLLQALAQICHQALRHFCLRTLTLLLNSRSL